MTHQRRPIASASQAEKLLTPPPVVLVTLVVGDVAQWLAMGRNLPEISGFYFAGFDDLVVSLMHDLSPTMILSPLIMCGFDAGDVVDRLSHLGFTGKYRAVTTYLPNADMVRAEIRDIAPMIDVDLIILPE